MTMGVLQSLKSIRGYPLDSEEPSKYVNRYNYEHLRIVKIDDQEKDFAVSVPTAKRGNMVLSRLARS